jgi:hypothetical protein
MNLRILAEAEAESRAAMLYYEDRCEGLGADFHQALNGTMQRIAEQPLRFPVYEGKALSREFRRARWEASVHRCFPGASEGNPDYRRGTHQSKTRLLGIS